MRIRPGRCIVANLLLAAGLVLQPVLSARAEVVAPAAQMRAAPEQAGAWRERAAAFGARDMVVAAHPAAVSAGAQILRQGGSAVDAAIAVQLVLNLVEPQSSGIGGGGFMLFRAATDGRMQVYDGRETAPAAVAEDLFQSRRGVSLSFRDAVDSGLSVGVPGLLRMLELAHREHGRLAWSALFEPAIRLARTGFAVSPRLHGLLTHAYARVRASPSASRYFLDSADQIWPIGHRLRDSDFADTLARIASEGADAFYRGAIATDIVAAVRGHARPGRIIEADLRQYRALVRAPVCGWFRAFQVCGVPPPSSGGLSVLQSLALFERLNQAGSMPDAKSAHLLSESYRLVYADRAAWIADPDYFDVPVQELLANDYLDERAALVHGTNVLEQTHPGQPLKRPAAGDATRALPSTSHMSIVDGAGNLVSMTSSIEQAFGSMTRVRGFLLNNQLTDFSFASRDAAGRAVANRVEPGKRPRSSMAPTIILDRKDRPVAVLGSPGGSQIIQYVSRTIIALVDWRMRLDRALAMPHFGARYGPVVLVEDTPDGDAMAVGLTAAGREVRRGAQNSGIHAIVFNGLLDGQPAPFAIDSGRGLWVGAADPRREGQARDSRPIDVAGKDGGY